MVVLSMLVAVALIASAVADRRKTVAGLRRALAMFLTVLPPLLAVLCLVSVSLWFLPPDRIRSLFAGESKAMAMVAAAVVGSIALIPGFVAYPLSGMLVSSGVSLDVVAVFVTTLMMVGVLTLPVEIRYFGVRTAVLRNALALAGALVVGLLMGVAL